MGRDEDQPEADVIIGAITWKGSGGADGPRSAETLRLAPYLLARRGRASTPPERRA
jgi:hypothetical protein